MTRRSAVIDRLRLRHPGRQDERHATWLELFFDLVFVLALSGVTTRLDSAGHPDAAEIAVAFGIFLLVQWAWIGQCYYDTRYDPDDGWHRLLVLIATVGAGTMALGVRHAPVGVLLPTGYVVVHGALLLMYLRVFASDRAARPLVTVYLTGFGTGLLLWSASLAVSPSTRPILWIIALAIELATPWAGRRRLARHPVHVVHLPERLGQLTIILLGSTLANLRDAVPDRPRPPAAALMAAGVALLIPISLWWVYTTYVSTQLAVPRLGNGLPYGYLHAPAGAAILFLGWSMGEIVHVAAEGTHRLPTPVRAVYNGSLVVWLLCAMSLQWIALGRLPRIRLVIGALTVTPLVVIAVAVATPLRLLALTAAVMVGFAAMVTPEISRMARQR